MHDAANLGSPEAQAELGDRYDRGDGVPRDADQARKYFRLCSAQGVARCQYRLGSLMYDMPSGPERSYEQAIAWFQLAGEQGVEEAKDIASREAPRLTPEQTRWITGFKAQLASAWRSREL
jgi:TPR repeat protein